jgi:hypothetical protein
MKLKRGTIREDGKVFWIYNSRSLNGEYWVSKEKFDHLQLCKKKRLKSKTELFNQKTQKIIRGTIREDGMIFWGYHPDCRDCEKWMSKHEYNKKKSDRRNKILKSKKLNGVRMRGDTREDGMIFLCYSPSYSNGERWVTKREFENLKIKQKVASKKFYWKNPEKGREQTREWRIKNPNAGKIYFQSNKNKIYCDRNKRIKECPLLSLRMRIHNNIKNSLQKMGFKKNTKTENILGCSFGEFKAHIESQFQPDMSWDNRHLWHIDHIMPVSMAKTEDEIIRLNHYRNLRPLWAHENIAKADKTPEILVLF